jgi:4-amino-4-deoxy-L-arabinose transferase-like glycosyltransferase
MSHQHVRVLSIPVILLALVCLGIFVSPLLMFSFNPSHPDSNVFVGAAAVWLLVAAMITALTSVLARFLKPTFSIAVMVVIVATLLAVPSLLYIAGPAEFASMGMQQFMTLIGVSLLPPTILGWLIGRRLRLRRGRYAILPRS